MDVLHRRGRATVGEVMAELTGDPPIPLSGRNCACSRTKGHVRHEAHQLRYVYLPRPRRTPPDVPP